MRVFVFQGEDGIRNLTVTGVQSCALPISRVSAANEAFNVLPLISDWVFVSADANPPSQAACAAVARRCFNPAAMANSYDYAVLHAAGNKGEGKTIAVVDSFGATPVRQDLAAFNTPFGLPHLFAEPGP